MMLFKGAAGGLGIRVKEGARRCVAGSDSSSSPARSGGRGRPRQVGPAYRRQRGRESRNRPG